LRNTKKFAQSKRHTSKAENKSAWHYTAKHRSILESGKYTRISDEHTSPQIICNTRDMQQEYHKHALAFKTSPYKNTGK
jgi:hypothetical protein